MKAIKIESGGYLMVAKTKLQQEEQAMSTLKNQPLWKKILEFKIGIIPVAIYVPFFMIIYLLMSAKKLPNDMLSAGALMILYGFACGELGKRIPILRTVGGSAIMATFLPSFMVAYKLIPLPAVKTVTSFMKTTNFLYVFIALIVVGSIISMNRKVLIKAFLKMFIPLMLGSLAATGVGVGVGTLLGIGVYKSFFFIVVPIMAGGVGEGALPLSMGYASILKTAQDELFAQVLPVVMLGSLTAIILAGLLKRLGEIRPQYSGNGSLLKAGDDDVLKHTNKNEERSFDLTQMMLGATLALGLYMLGVYLNYLIGLPAPIVMLFAAVLIKVCNLLPKKIEDGSYAIYRFTVIGITYPLLLGVGVAMTPWKSLVAVITNPSYIITIFFTVLTMVVVAFFVGKWTDMNPIETAIVTACHSGQGGTGDIAILTAADRLVLMPFAQVSTRIGGAATVTLAIVFLKWIIG